MAGSYGHVASDAERTRGQLLEPRDVASMLENPGDVWEAVEQMFDMIWFLDGQVNPSDPSSAVSSAEANYRAGLDISPGVMDDLELPGEFD